VDVSDLRKGILRALDDARRQSASRRAGKDEAGAAYTRFLDTVAVPLLRQAQDVLRAERHAFSVESPAGSARLSADAAPQTFLEVTLDTSGAEPQVIGRVSLTRGRQGVVIEEAPIAPGKPIAELGDTDIASFLLTAIPKLVVK
jgi:hypothetical protein